MFYSFYNGSRYLRSFESLGKGRQSLTISLLRQFIITLPLAYILLKVIGLNGIWLSFVIAEGIASVIAVILIKKNFITLRWINDPPF